MSVNLDLEYLESHLQKHSELILLVEHQEAKVHKLVYKVDLRFFCGYDVESRSYFLYGRRFSSFPRKDSAPFCFDFKKSKDLISFITETIGYNEKYGITLYNYNNLTEKEDEDFCFEFFESLMDRRYEIAGYDNCSFDNNAVLQKFVKLLKKTALF